MVITRYRRASTGTWNFQCRASAMAQVASSRMVALCCSPYTS
jgi:hypothetical protein